MGSEWGDISNHDGLESGRNPHVESFNDDWQADAMWCPPLRSIKTGHRVSIGNYTPIETRRLNWRWWLAEIPMRILARHMAKVTSIRDRSGEAYISDGREESIEEF
jgi:hypothetical protein